MQRPLLIIGLAVNMIALFLGCMGLILKSAIIMTVGVFVIMLNIFLSVLALVTKSEETFSQFTERVASGTPLARHAPRPAPLPRQGRV
ncbi:TPA_asm: ORFX protein [Anacyclus depressus waikavirus]|uniref:ORFX protein n=1 Tax=Anacyclus depressus waikavirus TaxID=3027335 RepID=A0AA48P934_9SECO|nr:TPA_asm: ORFX protein [Anacyclus depressus waikavirus]